MQEFKLKVITNEEHMELCKKEIEKKGLYNAVKEQLDEWVEICHPLGYLGFIEASEKAINVLDLIYCFYTILQDLPINQLSFERNE